MEPAVSVATGEPATTGEPESEPAASAVRSTFRSSSSSSSQALPEMPQSASKQQRRQHRTPMTREMNSASVAMGETPPPPAARPFPALRRQHVITAATADLWPEVATAWPRQEPADSQPAWGSFWRPAPLPPPVERAKPALAKIETLVPLLDRIQKLEGERQRLRQACPYCQEGGRGELCTAHQEQHRLLDMCPHCETGGLGPLCSTHQEELRLSTVCPRCDPHGRGGLCVVHHPNTALLAATTSGDFSLMMHAMNTQGADANAADEYGVSVLYRASGANQQGGVAMLLQAGANVNLTTQFGESALMRAAANGHLEVCQQLLTAGADPTIKARGGYDAHWYSQEFPQCQQLIKKAVREFVRDRERATASPPRAH